jgi:hypothetical protein
MPPGAAARLPSGVALHCYEELLGVAAEVRELLGGLRELLGVAAEVRWAYRIIGLRGGAVLRVSMRRDACWEA